MTVPAELARITTAVEGIARSLIGGQRRLPRLTVLSLVVVLACAGGCGGKSQSASTTATSRPAPTKTHFAKTKFVLHAGLAFGAFHRYVYKPFKAGKLGGGLLTNKRAKIKAALAAAFAYHEVRLALDAARSSRILSKALAPLLALQTKLSSMKSGLRRGRTSEVVSSNSDIASVSSASRAAGQPIQDQPTPSLGG
jgi:hypothetical protein